MKLKHLESCLSSLPNRVFRDPKVNLEQYPTSMHLAASVTLSALQKGDAGPGTSVLDLGCGTGMLGLGFALVDSDMVYLVDCDSDALDLARENVAMLEEEELIGAGSEGIDGARGCLGVELIKAKVKYVPPARERSGGGGRSHRGGRGRGGRGKRGKGRGSNTAPSSTPPNDILYSPPNNNEDDGIPLPSKIVDTVITNPPFGTKNNEGIDVQFLKTSIRLARRTVYSFHKTSTRAFLLKLLREKWGLEADVVAEMKFDIPKMYEFHKQKHGVDVAVDLLRISLPKEVEENEFDFAPSGSIPPDKGEAEDDDEGEEMPLGLCGHA